VGVCESTRTNLQAAPFAARERIIHIYNGAWPADIRAIPRPKKRVHFAVCWPFGATEGPRHPIARRCNHTHAPS
jgi:hypothetical protein